MYVYICMYACMYVCMYFIYLNNIVRMSGFDLIHTYSSDALAHGILKSLFAFTNFLMPLPRSEPVAYICMYVCIFVFIYVFIYVCIYIYVCVCMYICMFVCIYVCMYVCMY